MNDEISRAINSLHPILLFAAAYILALLFSVFVCFSIFNRYYTGSSEIIHEQPTGIKNNIIPDHKAIVNCTGEFQKL